MTTLLDEAHTPEEIAVWWQRFGLDHAAARQQREAAYAAQKAEWERIRDKKGGDARWTLTPQT